MRGSGGLTHQRADRLTFVESERCDVHEADDVRRVRPERSHDLTAVGVTDDDRRAVLPGQHLAEANDVVCERATGTAVL